MNHQDHIHRLCNHQHLQKDHSAQEDTDYSPDHEHSSCKYILQFPYHTLDCPQFLMCDRCKLEGDNNKKTQLKSKVMLSFYDTLCLVLPF